MEEQQFRADLVANGYDCREFALEANRLNPEHTHAWHARLFIQEGELTLATPEGEHTYGPGSSCTLEADTPHSERVGAKGVKGLLGTKPREIAGLADSPNAFLYDRLGSN